MYSDCSKITVTYKMCMYIMCTYPTDCPTRVKTGPIKDLSGVNSSSHKLLVMPRLQSSTAFDDNDGAKNYSDKKILKCVTKKKCFFSNVI